MENFPALLALCAGNSPVTGGFPSQRAVTRSFDVFFDLRLNKRLSKHSRCQWFETPSCSLWRHYNAFCSCLNAFIKYWCNYCEHLICRDRFLIQKHNSDVIMSAMASQITSLTIVYSTLYSETYQRKHQNSTSLAFVRGIHRWPVDSPHKGPVTRKFKDVIMVHTEDMAQHALVRVRHGIFWCSKSSCCVVVFTASYMVSHYIRVCYKESRLHSILYVTNWPLRWMLHPIGNSQTYSRIDLLSICSEIAAGECRKSSRMSQH